MFGYTTTRVTFEVVAQSRSKSGKCKVCGKTCKRTERREQTINPFNKDKDGMVKDKRTIYRELNAELDAWMLEPIVHARCET